MWRILFISVLIFLAGCVILPIPSLAPEPYGKDLIAGLGEGEVYRDDVLEKLGTPHLRRAGDSIWIYGQSRNAAYVLIVGYGDADGFWWPEYQFVVVEFDGDRVVSIELSEEKSGCAANGVCLEQGAANPGDKDQTLSPAGSVVASKRVNDRRAKSFTPTVGMCSLYFYTEDPYVLLELDASPAIAMVDETYLYLTLSPGEHQVALGRIRGQGRGTHSFQCSGGEMLFLEGIVQRKLFSKTEVTIAPVAVTTGREAILARKLLLSDVVDDLERAQYGSLRDSPDHGLFVYRTVDRTTCPLHIEIDGAESLRVPSARFYLRFDLPAGHHSIAAISRNEQRAQLELTLEAGIRRYFQIRMEIGCEIELKEVDQDVAAGELEERMRMPSAQSSPVQRRSADQAGSRGQNRPEVSSEPGEVQSSLGDVRETRVSPDSLIPRPLDPDPLVLLLAQQPIPDAATLGAAARRFDEESAAVPNLAEPADTVRDCPL